MIARHAADAAVPVRRRSARRWSTASTTWRGQEIERIRDFIILHYKLTERDDSPSGTLPRRWTIPDSLAERIALFRESAQAYQAPDELFRVDSWVQVMLGQRLEPRGCHHARAS